LLPELDRVLYLDADTIVTGPLDELFARDLSHYALAAVVNPLYAWMSDTFLQGLGVPSICKYFNSGVLLMNLDDWRANRYTESILEFGCQQDVGDWPDQNALNAVLWSKCDLIPPRWNALTVYFYGGRRYLCYSASDVDAAREDPAIVHFIGPYKPWHYRSKHPFRAEYFEHARKTPWGDQPVIGRTPLHALVRLLPWTAGLRVESHIFAAAERLKPYLPVPRTRAARDR
jgi:lipopolysaccharide biosynthesis glycosyltransferase